MVDPFFTIIIPIFNGHDVIGKALDSIYSQGLSDDQFEVICVDDCSPTMETLETLYKYTYNGVHPHNLKVFRHEINRRQGGARNTGLKHAKGKWILYLDADDYFAYKSLPYLYDFVINHSSCDVIVFEKLVVNTLNVKSYQVSGLQSDNKNVESVVISGKEFVQTNPVPWSPWSKVYKKDFLQNSEIRFEENVRFEDIDYSLKSVLMAENVAFFPLIVYCYVCVGGSTVTIGNDRQKIEEYLMASVRIKEIIENEDDVKVSKAILNHYDLMMTILLKSALWRLSYREIVCLLKKYPLLENSLDAWVEFALYYPKSYAVMACMARPFLYTVIWLRNKLKK